MKVFKRFLRAFGIGFILAFLMQFFTMCPSDNPANPVPEKPLVETGPMKIFSDQVISAFQSGDKNQVMNLMYDDYKDIYSKELDGTTGNMTAFATALGNRKLIAASDLYAVYEIEIGGQKYTISYGNSGDGVWKLNRF